MCFELTAVLSVYVRLGGKGEKETKCLTRIMFVLCKATGIPEQMPDQKCYGAANKQSPVHKVHVDFGLSVGKCSYNLVAV